MLNKILFPIIFIGIISLSYSGSINGTITLPDKIERPPRPPKIHSYAGAKKSKKTAPLNEMENVIVYIEKVKAGKFSPMAERMTMDQVDETFSPHVLPVLVGTSVDFLNKDDFYHNVFSYSRAKTFDLGKYPKGMKRSVLFDKTGLVEIYCEIHSYMQAFVLVLQNPYFTKPDSQGNFHLDNMPVGKYNLIAWHDALKQVSQPVDIGEDGKVQVDFVLKKK